MAPFLTSAPGVDSQSSRNDAPRGQSIPRLLIIGAGSRGNSYARAVTDSKLAIVTAVVEPIRFKRQQLGKRYIWQGSSPVTGQEFEDWTDFIAYEQQRRKDEIAGVVVPPGVDGVFVCVKDDLHATIVTHLAPLGLHIMCEKPLATTLSDCLAIQKTLNSYPDQIFAIGHVLRYSPHNMLLRHLLLERNVIGEVISMEHVEPVGWWHFSHSYVRGHWRKESTSAPSLLTKSCHDIDFILWMLCSPLAGSSPTVGPHLPSTITSAGSLKQFTWSRKPQAAGTATNCLACPIRDTCMYSAPRIYYDRHFQRGNYRWPVEIVNPEVEHLAATQGQEAAKKALFDSLAEDYNAGTTPVEDIESRPWFGRCVWDSDNDVCDDQVVTFEWEDGSPGQRAKTATFHMIAQTLAQCERRGRIYGTTGEISYDSKSIVVHDFTSEPGSEGCTRRYNPEVPKNSHHGGGDDGLTQQFIKAVVAVNGGKMSVPEAQAEFLGCTLEDAVRSHAAVFAAEEARREKKVVDWTSWWRDNVETPLEAAVS